MAVSLDLGREVFLAAAGLGAGIVNGIAGGGSLISFPALLAVGLPALPANVTSTVGIWPGYFGGSAGFRTEVREMYPRLRELSLSVVAGGVLGGILLLTTPSHAFRLIAPWLVLFACLLFGFQPLISRRLRLDHENMTERHKITMHVGVFFASVYGAYFGAGLGVVLLAILGICLSDDLLTINGLRSVLALLVNSVAVLIFIIHAPIAWNAVAVMAIASLIGGYLGSRLARVVPRSVLRVVVIGLGITTSITLLVS